MSNTSFRLKHIWRASSMLMDSDLKRTVSSGYTVTEPVKLLLTRRPIGLHCRVQFRHTFTANWSKPQRDVRYWKKKDIFLISLISFATLVLKTKISKASSVSKVFFGLSCVSCIFRGQDQAHLRHRVISVHRPEVSRSSRRRASFLQSLRLPPPRYVYPFEGQSTSSFCQKLGSDRIVQDLLFCSRPNFLHSSRLRHFGRARLAGPRFHVSRHRHPYEWLCSL